MAARKTKKSTPKKSVSQKSSKHSFWATVIILLVLVNAVFLAGWLLT